MLPVAQPTVIMLESWRLACRWRKDGQKSREQVIEERVGRVLHVVGVLLVVAAIIAGCCLLGNGASQWWAKTWNESVNEVDATPTAMADEDNAPFATQTTLALTPTPTPTFVHHITDIVTHHKPDNDLNG